MGHKVAVRVSPVIRKDEATSIMALELTRAKDDASIDDIDANSYSDNSNKLNISNYLGVPSIFRPGTGASGAKLLDLNSGRVWSAINGSGVFLDLTPGEKITSYLSLNSPRVFLLGLRPQECSVQEGWDQALNRRPPH